MTLDQSNYQIGCLVLNNIGRILVKGDTTLGVFTGQGGVQGRVFEDIDF